EVVRRLARAVDAWAATLTPTRKLDQIHPAKLGRGGAGPPVRGGAVGRRRYPLGRIVRCARSIRPSIAWGHAMSLPLEGLLVADFSHVLAGPLAATMLADLG